MFEKGCEDTYSVYDGILSETVIKKKNILMGLYWKI